MGYGVAGGLVFCSWSRGPLTAGVGIPGECCESRSGTGDASWRWEKLCDATSISSLGSAVINGSAMPWLRHISLACRSTPPSRRPGSCGPSRVYGAAASAVKPTDPPPSVCRHSCEPTPALLKTPCRRTACLAGTGSGGGFVGERHSGAHRGRAQARQAMYTTLIVAENHH